MPEPKNYVFSYIEMAEMMVKKLGIHEGLWGLYFEFSMGGANVPTSPDGKTLAPAAITFVKNVGIQMFEAQNNLTVDAALVNPIEPRLPLSPGKH